MYLGCMYSYGSTVPDMPKSEPSCRRTKKVIHYRAIDGGVQAVVIAAGGNPDTITKILNGEQCGTLFLGYVLVCVVVVSCVSAEWILVAAWGDG